DLHHLAKAHAGRAHALAVAAHEAEVELLRVARISRVDRTFRDASHQVDPPARARRFRSGQPIGRTGAKTQPAVDAVERRGVFDELLRIVEAHASSLSNRSAAKTRPGSSASRRRRISASSTLRSRRPAPSRRSNGATSSSGAPWIATATPSG